MFICGPEDKSTTNDSSKQSSTTLYSHSLLMCGGDDDDDDCWLPVITAPPAHMSLLSQQMMGHLCPTGATGIVGPFLTRLLITPSGHGEGPWRERGAWIDAVQQGISCLVASQRCRCCCPTSHDMTAESQKTHEKLSSSLATHVGPWRS